MSIRQAPTSSMTDRHNDANTSGVASSLYSPMKGASPVSGSPAEHQRPDETQTHNLYGTSQLSSDDESRTLDFETDDDSDQKDSLMLEFSSPVTKSRNQSPPDDLSDKEKLAEIINLARKLAALGVPASIDGALLDEVDFLVDSASRVVDVVDEQGDKEIHSARGQSLEL